MRKLKQEIWPHQISLKIRQDDKVETEMVAWCNENLGHRFKQWFSYSFDVENRLYAFKDEGTLLVFKLKWGQYVIR